MVFELTIFFRLGDVPEAGIWKGIFLEEMLGQATSRARRLADRNFEYADTVWLQEEFELFAEHWAFSAAAHHNSSSIIFRGLGAEMFSQRLLEFFDPFAVDFEYHVSREREGPMMTASCDPWLAMTAVGGEQELVHSWVVDVSLQKIEPVWNLLRKVMFVDLEAFKTLPEVGSSEKWVDDLGLQKARSCSAARAAIFSSGILSKPLCMRCFA
jgi:hypothetical protein